MHRQSAVARRTDTDACCPVLSRIRKWSRISRVCGGHPARGYRPTDVGWEPLYPRRSRSHHAAGDRSEPHQPAGGRNRSASGGARACSRAERQLEQLPEQVFGWDVECFEQPQEGDEPDFADAPREAVYRYADGRLIGPRFRVRCWRWSRAFSRPRRSQCVFEMSTRPSSGCSASLCPVRRPRRLCAHTFLPSGGVPG
jgi:hypothetical protein